jgi:Uma2 family endonuclease
MMASSYSRAIVMTQAKPRFATFEEYLSYSDDLEGRFQLINGELIELPPESPENDFFANYLMVAFLNIGIAPLQLIRSHTCEIQVPVLQSNDAANRYPDLVVLRQEHLELMGRRLTVTLDMPPPRLIVEIVSPGKTNHDRDYINKRSQYAAIVVPEYWLIDPSTQTVMVLELQGNDYSEVGAFRGSDLIASHTFPELTLTAEQIFQYSRS